MQQQVPITTTTTEPESPDATAVEPRPAEDELIVDDLLVEDVSIDGMCGVY
jgi:mycofactocin precursor